MLVKFEQNRVVLTTRNVELFDKKVSIFKTIFDKTLTSGVARAFPGGRLPHPEGQYEEENEKKLRKSKKNWSKFEEKMKKVELLPTWDSEAGYGPGVDAILEDISVAETIL